MQSANIIFEELKPFVGSYLEFELFCMQNFEHTYDEALLIKADLNTIISHPKFEDFMLNTINNRTLDIIKKLVLSQTFSAKIIGAQF